MTETAPLPADQSDENPGAFETLDGEVVIYDQTNPDAWIQSTVSIDFDEIWETETA